MVGAPAERGFPNPPYTTLDTTPVSREKPYLFVDAAGAVHGPGAVGAARHARHHAGPSGVTPGRTIPLRDFFVAKPSDSVQEINRALDRGQAPAAHPGRLRHRAQPRRSSAGDTVVLGLGHATLTADRGAVPLTVGRRARRRRSPGLTIDAGPERSPVLLQVGKRQHGHGHGHGRHGRALDPITLSDVYFRVGGPHIGGSAPRSWSTATTC